MWNYAPRAASLAEHLLSYFRTDITELSLVPGGGGCFEISKDGVLVFSKLSLGRYPDPQEIVQKLS